MKPIGVISIFVFLLAFHAHAFADSIECSDLLSGLSAELRSSIHDLAKLRFDLDQRLIRGEDDVLMRTLRDQYLKKENEILAAAKLDRDTLVTKLQKEIQFIQSESVVQDSIKKAEQKELTDHETSVRRAGLLLDTSYWFAHALLPDERVILTGGNLPGGASSTSIQIFDPKTGKTEKFGDLTEGKRKHRLTVLQDGRILVLGGENGSQAKNAIEVIDPKTKEVKVIGYLKKERKEHSQSLMKDGRVLLVGDAVYDTDLITVLDPNTGILEDIGRLVEGRCQHGQTVLDDGSVIVTGGFGGIWANRLQSIERIDPATGESKIVGQLKEPRRFHGQTLLPDGRILITGGSSVDGKPTASIEIFDPKTGESKIVGHLVGPRSLHKQSLLPDGRVLVAGGEKGVNQYCESIEVIDPELGTSQEIGLLIEPRTDHGQELLSSGEVLIFGGISKNFDGKSIELIKVQRK